MLTTYLNEAQSNHPGFDIRSQKPDGDRATDLKFIEVKGRAKGRPPSP